MTILCVHAVLVGVLCVINKHTESVLLLVMGNHQRQHQAPHQTPVAHTTTQLSYQLISPTPLMVSIKILSQIQIRCTFKFVMNHHSINGAQDKRPYWGPAARNSYTRTTPATHLSKDVEYRSAESPTQTLHTFLQC